MVKKRGFLEFIKWDFSKDSVRPIDKITIIESTFTALYVVTILTGLDLFTYLILREGVMDKEFRILFLRFIIIFSITAIFRGIWSYRQYKKYYGYK